MDENPQRSGEGGREHHRGGGHHVPVCHHASDARRRLGRETIGQTAVALRRCPNSHRVYAYTGKKPGKGELWLIIPALYPLYPTLKPSGASWTRSETLSNCSITR